MKLRNRFSVVLALVLALVMIPTALADEVYPVFKVREDGSLPDSAINATAGACYDVNTQTFLWAQNEDQRLYPASITKIMTCLVALEYAEKTSEGLSEKITAPQYYDLEEGAVKIYIHRGEVFTLENLLYALMLKSANDAALLIAYMVGGSTAGFADLMNAKAAELGMTGTHYMNPHGLHDPQHYTTARDMAILMAAATKNETFCQIDSTRTYTIPATNKEEERKMRSSNRLMDTSNEEFYYEYCRGAKTGYTGAAGYTFVCYGEKDGRTVVAVVLKAPSTEIRFASGRNLLRYGLEYFEVKDMAQVLTSGTITGSVKGSEEFPEGEVPVLAEQRTNETCIQTVRRNVEYGLSDPTAYQQLVLWDDLVAPISVGQRLGVVQYRYNDELVLTAELFSTQEIRAAQTTLTTTAATTVVTDPATGETLKPRKTLIRAVRDFLSDHFWVIWVAVALFFVLIFLLVARIASWRRRPADGYRYDTRRYSNSKYQVPPRSSGRRDRRYR